MHRPGRMRHTSSAWALAIALAAGACEYRPASDQQQQPTDSAAPVATTGDTTTSAAAAAPRGDTSLATVTDSTRVRLHPAAPRRGDAVFAYADGVASDSPRCSWKGATLPCQRWAGGVLAILPLQADEPAGTFSLVIEHPGGRIARQVTVRDRDFGRTLVFLDPPRHALVQRQADIARDARAVMGVLRAQNGARAWHARWREPVALQRADGYGVERSYHLASDSSRAIQLESRTSARGAFGGDTTTATGAPAWRHAGVDIAAARGTRVLAPAAGTVADVGDYVLTGRTVLVDHGVGVFSAYFHLDTVLVRRGDEVAQGKILGRVGSTGLSTGPHLHYGIYVHGKDVDPVGFHAMPRWAYDSAAVAALRRDTTAARRDTSAATKADTKTGGGAGH